MVLYAFVDWEDGGRSRLFVCLENPQKRMSEEIPHVVWSFGYRLSEKGGDVSG